ncbi:galactose mutarotase-like domain-containing protein [Xylariomycetidae sp. FL0641]|nr:galactose mutarotase-like domain-containing protein [Xylariomycetidae sp. FL0641]
MRFCVLLQALAAAQYAAAQAPEPGEDGKYTISSSGIKAQFIPYGATLTNLFVKDKDGNDIDVVLGYDDIDYYPKDPGHPVYNSIPGRYVNRIGKGTYTLGNETYHTEINDGTNTLHSGTNNWSYRTWNATAATEDSITFSIRDEAFSSEGMPGLVLANVTYSVSNGTWKIHMEASAPEVQTPLMLTHHTYFNLDAYRDPTTSTIWNHTLSMPYSSRYLVADSGAVPTGEIATATPGGVNDFASAADLPLGHARADPAFAGNCDAGGGACEGYNGYFLIEDAPAGAPVLTLASPFSGVRAELRTDQNGVVLYTCNWMDGSADLKSTQGTEKNKKVTRSSCVAIEAQNFVDGINHPEWGHRDDEITGPEQAYSWESSWTFGTL